MPFFKGVFQWRIVLEIPLDVLNCNPNLRLKYTNMFFYVLFIFTVMYFEKQM